MPTNYSIYVIQVFAMRWSEFLVLINAGSKL